MWEAAITGESDPALWVGAMGRAFLESAEHRPVISNLWVQALAEAGDDEEIRSYLRDHMREVHQFVADVIRGAQAAHGIPEDRDADAEAWIFLSIGLLSMADRVVEGLNAQWPEIVGSRRRWLTGKDLSPREKKSFTPR